MEYPTSRSNDHQGGTDVLKTGGDTAEREVEQWDSWC